MRKAKASFMFAVALGILAVVPNAKADEWNQKTVFTFSGPVEIPGQVLPAGTYVFKLASSPSNRNIVQVFSKDEKHVYGTFLAIPDYRMRPADKPLINFAERPAGQPEAIKAWFYPGRNYGHEFVYPKPKAVALAKANHTPVPAMPAEFTENTTNPTATLSESHVVAMSVAPLKAEKPAEPKADTDKADVEEVEVAEVFAVEAPAAPADLPATGSPLPLVALAGLLSIAVAGALRFASVRVK